MRPPVRLIASFTTAVSMPGTALAISAHTTSSPAISGGERPPGRPHDHEDLSLTDGAAVEAHVGVLAVADGVGADAGVGAGLGVVTHKEHRVERPVERRDGCDAPPREAAHDVDLRIDLVEKEVGEHLDAVILLHDELGGTRRPRPATTTFTSCVIHERARW